MARLSEIERKLSKISAQEARIDEEKAQIAQEANEKLCRGPAQTAASKRALRSCCCFAWNGNSPQVL